MSGLAKLLAESNKVVTGSDIRRSSRLDSLSDIGVEVWAGHQPDRISANIDLMVISSAVPDQDPEVRAARRKGVQVWRRPELLAAISAEVDTVGPTGTHGKTSSTAMLLEAARAAGQNPSFVVGEHVMGLGTNAGMGSDPWMVLEVDEAFRTFEQVKLKGLVITNVEAEHMEHFETVDNLESSFVKVARGVKGPVLAGIDDPGARRVAMRAGIRGFGLSEEADWRIMELSEGVAGVSFQLHGGGSSWKVQVPFPGVHMARNAAGVLALCGEMGLDLDRAVEGIARYRGVRRRYENRGVVAGVTIIDDYAHHPSEISATLRAAVESGHRRVWAIFQPHLYSRTAQMFTALGSALSLAHHIVITDVYGAREEPQPGVSGELVAAAARRAGGRAVQYYPHRSEVAERVAPQLREGDLVVAMGAGDVTMIPTELLRLLAEGAQADE
jgi:UDP-N-acetylmuramate--alanine ligase